MATPYNILSLDGGGSWALLQVRCLQALFGDEARGHTVLRRFDLVAANSGGSIVLAGLVADLPLSALLGIFRNQASRRDIFSPTPVWGWRLWHSLGRVLGLGGPIFRLGPRYATAHKLGALQQHLGDLENHWRGPGLPVGSIATLCLDDVPAYVGGSAASGPHVLIPAFDYNRQRSTFFRSDRDSYGDGVNLEGQLWHTTPVRKPGKAVRLLEAVHASSTAPVNFFDRPAHVLLNGQENYLWDGGVAGYNNPVLAAVTEALTNDIAAERIRVLSIGTGSQVFPVRQPTQGEPEFAALVTEPTANAGFLDDIRKLASAIVGAPPDAASFVAFTALNPGFLQRQQPNRNFIRANLSFQPWLEPGQNRWLAPPGFDETTVKAIKKLELDATTEAEVALIERLGDAWLADCLRNQPIRASSALKCLLGQDTFGEVRAAFKVMFP